MEYNGENPRVSPRVSPRENALQINIKTPREGDNDAMLLWRMTVDPRDNIGEPFQAQWVNFDESSNVRSNRFIIKKGTQRYMLLYYYNEPLLSIGSWVPGNIYEYVNSPNNGGEYDEFLPSAYVKHDNVPKEGLHIIYPSVKRELIPVGNLDETWLKVLTEQLWGKGKKYIKNFISRYIVTPTFTDRHTANHDKELRDNIARLFIEAGDEPPSDAESFVTDKWYIRNIEANPKNGDGWDDYNMLFLNTNLLNDDMDLGILYNKKGFRRQPANKAEIQTEFKDVHQYISKIKKTPEKGRTRRRNQRKRDKKLLNEYYNEQETDNTNFYYGGRRRVTLNCMHKRVTRKTRAKK